MKTGRIIRVAGIIVVVGVIVAAIVASMNQSGSNAEKVWDAEMTVGNMDAKNYFIIYSDLACPYCAGRGVLHPCDVDGIFATCPECGEQYDVGSGTAVPQKGLAREPLLRIPLTNSGGVITVRQ